MIPQNTILSNKLKYFGYRAHFFLRCLVLLVLAGLSFGRSLERVLLILAALFLWIRCFFAARSAREIALIIASFDFFRPEADRPLDDFLAIRRATSRFVRIFRLTWAFLLELLKARFAVLVTGILFSHFSFGKRK